MFWNLNPQTKTPDYALPLIRIGVIRVMVKFQG